MGLSNPRISRLIIAIWTILIIAPQPIAVVSMPVQGENGGSRAAGPSENADYSKESAVVQTLRTVVSFRNDGAGTREETARIQVQSQGGLEDWGLLSFGFNSANQEVEIAYVRVMAPDGTVVTTPLTDVQDVTDDITREAPMYSDHREKHVPVKGLKVGGVLEYKVITRDRTPLVPNQFWFDFNFDKEHIVLDQQLRVSVPKDREVKVKSPDFKPTVLDEGKQRIYIWKTDNRERKEWEYNPDVLPPNIQISTFKTWEEVGRWWGTLERVQATVTPEVRAREAELAKDARNEGEKLGAIYNYVAMKYRYVSISFGIGRYEPHAAAEILKNGYGDCKDKHTLLASLLAAAGIPAYAALINSYRNLDPEVPSPGQFNHVISIVPQGKDWIWADTTSEVAPLGFLTSSLRDKQALAIPLDGTPALVTTPAAQPFKEFETIELEGKLSDNGTLECNVQRSARGDAEIGLRSEFRTVPQTRWKDIGRAFVYGTNYGGEASQVTATPPESTGAPFSYSYHFKGQAASDWTYKRLLLQFPILALPSPGEETERHEYPIDLGPPREITIKWKIELPPGYTPKLLPPLDLSGSLAEYHSAYGFKDGTLSYERRLTVKAKRVPVAQLAEYRSFCQKADEDVRAYTYLLTGAESFNAVPPSPEAARMVEEAREAYQRQDVKGAIELLEQAVKTDPHYPAGWIMLGYFQTLSGRRGEGVASLRKAVELVPKDLMARKALAEVLFNSQPEEATDAWREVLKLDPKDREAHNTLGKILLDQKKYGEAATELEAAAALSTPNASFQERIADAYFGAGENAKAFAALKKMTDLDPQPPTWNHVASLLAEHDSDLDEAQKLAERAVRAEEEKTGELHLDTLEPDDVYEARDLADYWDTLGWVYFRQGKLPQAERYLDAAWRLSPAGVIGDHLGQLYEKQGKKQAAIDVYALGLAANVPTQEVREDMYTRLLALMKVQANVDAKLKMARQESAHSPRLKMGKLSTTPGSGEFWLVVGRDGSVEQVRFISGVESFRSFQKAIASLKFKAPLPDDAPTKLLRRGVLVCAGGDYDCDFTLQDPRSVQHTVSVNVIKR
jgi:tetratricopeptide (TPR) repeat protein/transglutaminase-like putative cysteine protease